MLKAYATLEIEKKDKVYKYAETGFRLGGQFKPHKTHRNGLSVDFMTPMISKDGKSEHLPTHPLNRFGYDVELDEQGLWDDLRIDYTAMAAHIASLEKTAKKLGFGLSRVIFDPQLQPGLFATPDGAYLNKHVRFSKKRSWVRHDEHYHVDFAIPCKPL